MTKNATEVAYDLPDLRKRRTNARHYPGVTCRLVGGIC
jgi:hypothetical protein